MAEPPRGPALPKRFYRVASADLDGDGFALRLDGRPARTPARAPLRLPTRALGEAVAEEWGVQAGVIDPASMPLTRLANTAIDGVAPEIDAVRADIARYAESDLVLYRAGEPDSLVAAQAAAWDPVLAFVRAAFGSRFVLSEGVMFVPQPEAALAPIRKRLAAETSPFAVAALHVMTTLTGSALLALMHAEGRIDADAAWAAAHVDERHQESVWGEDADAVARRDAREAEFRVASRFYALAGDASLRGSTA